MPSDVQRSRSGSLERYAGEYWFCTLASRPPRMSWAIRIWSAFAFEMPARYYTRTEDAEGGNSLIVLTARAFYDPNDFGGVWRGIVVNTLTEAQLGLAGS